METHRHQTKTKRDGDDEVTPRRPEHLGGRLALSAGAGHPKTQ